MNYPALAAGAERLLRSAGAPCVLKTPAGPAAFDPATGESAQEYAVFAGVCVAGSYDARLADGKTILRTDRRMSCRFAEAAVAVRPGESLLETGGETLRVVDFRRVAPGGKTAILYVIQARGQ